MELTAMTWEKKWKIAYLCAMLNAIHVAAFFMAPTVLMPLIITSFHLTLAAAPIPIAVGKLAFVVFLIPGGQMLDYYGPQTCVLLGFSGLCVVMFCYAFFTNTFFELLMIHVFMALFASISGVPSYVVILAQWFTSNIGVAIGLVIAGHSLSGVISPFILAHIAEFHGWRTAMSFVSVLILFVAVPVSYFWLTENRAIVEESISSQPSEQSMACGDEHEHEHDLIPVKLEFRGEEPVSQEFQEIREDAGSTAASTANAPVEEGKKTEQLEGKGKWPSWLNAEFVTLATCYVLGQYLSGCFFENILLYLTVDKGFPILYASLFFAAINFAAMISKLSTGFFIGKVDIMVVSVLSASVACLGISFLFVRFGDDPSAALLGQEGSGEGILWPRLCTSPVMLMLFALVFGLGYGAIFNVLYSLPPLLFSQKNLGLVQSMLFGIGLLGNSAGAVLTGMIRVYCDSYSPAFLLALALALCLLYALYILGQSEQLSPLRLKTIKAGDASETTPLLGEGMKAVLAQQGQEETFSDQTVLDAFFQGPRRPKHIEFDQSELLSASLTKFRSTVPAPKEGSGSKFTRASSLSISRRDKMHKHPTPSHDRRPRVLHHLVDSNIISSTIEAFPLLHMNSVISNFAPYNPEHGNVRFGYEEEERENEESSV